MLAEKSPQNVVINALRIGDAVICTNPAELYVEHGLAIKKHSKASVTLVAELTNGFVGSVPTSTAFEKGGYSTQPGLLSMLVGDAGDKIVETTVYLLNKIF